MKYSLCQWNTCIFMILKNSLLRHLLNVHISQNYTQAFPKKWLGGVYLFYSFIRYKVYIASKIAQIKSNSMYQFTKQLAGKTRTGQMQRT